LISRITNLARDIVIESIAADPTVARNRGCASNISAGEFEGEYCDVMLILPEFAGPVEEPLQPVDVASNNAVTIAADVAIVTKETWDHNLC